MQRPFFSQSPKRVGSRPARPPVSGGRLGRASGATTVETSAGVMAAGAMYNRTVFTVLYAIASVVLIVLSLTTGYGLTDSTASTVALPNGSEMIEGSSPIQALER